MPSPSSDSAPKSRLALLLRLSESDPGNPELALDAAETALAENAPEAARDILHRFGEHAPLPEQLLSVAGLTAMRLGAFDEATPIFEGLLAGKPDDVSLKFNLAWSLAMTKQFTRALELLDGETTQALGQAAMLRVQLLHDAGDLDDAMATARAGLLVHPNHRGLLAAVSVLAIDAEDFALAAESAQGAGDHPDALTSLGAVALDQGRDAEASALFARALLHNPDAPRALIGTGLSRLLSGEVLEGAIDIERGAHLFQDHIGSWVAAGWARIFAKDYAAARANFDTALAIDASFSETHGSLAVLHVLEGRIDEAEREAQTALRLDRQSFSGALAKTLLLSTKGKHEEAQTLLQRALNTPIDASGRTLAQAIARRGLMS